MLLCRLHYNTTLLRYSHYRHNKYIDNRKDLSTLGRDYENHKFGWTSIAMMKFDTESILGIFRD